MGIRQEVLFPRKPYKRRPKPNFGVLDIETDGLGGKFILGATYDTINKVIFHQSAKKMLEYISQFPGTEWYAHNGARYDYLYFLENGSESKQFILDNFNASILSSKSSVIGISLHPTDLPPNKRRYDIKLKDFYRIIPFSLEEITDKFCVEYKKLAGTIDFEKETFNPNNPQHIEYLKHDVLSLYEAISKFSDIVFDTFGVKLGWTTPGMAMDAWLRTIEHSFNRMEKPQRDFIRKAYKGGMVQLRYATKPDIFYGVKKNRLKIRAFDRNSQYPAEMLKGVPTGSPIKVNEFFPDKPGFYHANITVPDNCFPFIPLSKADDESLSWGTFYPTGTFDAHLTSLELELLLENGGTINHIHSGYIFNQTAKIFDKFLSICQSIRYSQKGTVLEFVAKLFQNSLYGKFGTKEEIESFELAIFPKEEMAMAFIDEKTGEPIQYLWVTKKDLDVPYLHPEWASWITASSRVTLAREIIKLGDRFIYCDTDSIKFFDVGEPIDIDIDDMRYGAWKDEGIFTDMIITAPKTYALKYEIPQKDKKTGELKEWLIHTKGVPKKLVNQHDLLKALSGEDTDIAMGTMKSLKPMLKNNSPVEYQRITRNITKPANVRGFKYKDNQFSPYNYQEYKKIDCKDDILTGEG